MQCVRSDKAQGDEVTALKKDICDLQTKVQRMSDYHRSDVSCLKGKLKDVSQLLVDAHSQIESNSRAVLDTFASLRKNTCRKNMRKPFDQQKSNREHNKLGQHPALSGAVYNPKCR